MRSMHYYIKLAVVCASLGLTAIFGQAQEIAERNLSPLHWRYDVYNPQNEMFRLLGTKRSFSQNETFFFSHP